MLTYTVAIPGAASCGICKPKTISNESLTILDLKYAKPNAVSSESKTVTVIKTSDVEWDTIGILKETKSPVCKDSTTTPSSIVGVTSPIVISGICATATNVSVVMKSQFADVTITE